jgi:hypothetical protein
LLKGSDAAKIVTQDKEMKMIVVNGVECYGELQDDSNFHVVCENEEDDDVWLEGNPDNEEDYTFSSWEEVVTVLSQFYDATIIEITAV